MDPTDDIGIGTSTDVLDATMHSETAESSYLCHDKLDGAYCDPSDQRRICIAGQCVRTWCGDGFANPHADEECEDGNDIEDDGCTRCQWDCESNSDCDDNNVCNGEETCCEDTHACLRGTAPAKLSICSLGEHGIGICNNGFCIPIGCGNGVVDHEFEMCDDGNTDSNDGCENDCTLSCQEDADCNDEDLCTGVETCNKEDPAKPVCVPGIVVDCVPEHGSCTGTCDPNTGQCTYPQIDSDNDGRTCEDDCDETDPDIRRGARDCLDGKDNDCNSATADGADGACTCYVDGDGDGYAAADALSITAVDCPESYTAKAPIRYFIDCLDTNAAVHPGQIHLFFAPHTLGFDYDCDGLLKKWDDNLLDCSTCRSGWMGDTVPDCGQSDLHRWCLPNGPFPCMPGNPHVFTQTCR